MVDKLRLTLLSFACCNPQLAASDGRYIDTIKEALNTTKLEAEVDLVHATEAQMTGRYIFMAEILPLFKKYGQAVSPALFINGKLTLYGGVPTTERLVEALEKAKVAVEQGRL